MSVRTLNIKEACKFVKEHDLRNYDMGFDKSKRVLFQKSTKKYSKDFKSDASAKAALAIIKYAEEKKPSGCKDVIRSVEKYSTKKHPDTAKTVQKASKTALEHLSSKKPAKSSSSHHSKKTESSHSKKTAAKASDYDRCMDFYYKKKKNVHGVTIEDIWGWNTKKLEKDHHFIQWIFPLRKLGKDPKAFLLDDKIAAKFRRSGTLQKNLVTSYDIMLKFYGLKMVSGFTKIKVVDKKRILEWTKPNGKNANHNFLRLNRIMESMRELGMEAYSKGLCDFLDDYLYQGNNDLKLSSHAKKTIRDSFEQHWYKAAHGHAFKKGKAKVVQAPKKKSHDVKKSAPKKKAFVIDKALQKRIDALKERAKTGKIEFYTDATDKLTGFLGNFHKSNIVVNLNDGTQVVFSTGEACFQSCKFHAHPAIKKKIVESKNGDEALRIVRKNEKLAVKGWHSVDPTTYAPTNVCKTGDLLKNNVMREALYSKFTQNEDLKQLLLATGKAKLVEQQPKDSKSKDRHWSKGPKGDGKNMLGKLLMELRSKLRQEERAK